MADVVDKATRSRMMSGIRGKDTKPEITLRKGLFARGFRFRLHAKNLPGKPDIVFPRLKSVILVHGCFWHRHDCTLFRWPSSNVEFWKEKIAKNREVDARTRLGLHSLDWKILTIWECSMKGPDRIGAEEVVTRAAAWLTSDSGDDEISGVRRMP